MLKIEKLNFSYGRERVLNGLSAEVKSGELLGIIGPNGSGKTTLLKLVAKILKPSSGGIFIDGRNVNKISAGEYAKKVSFLPSGIDVSFSYTVEELVSMGRFPYTGRYGNLSAADRTAVKNALEEFGLKRYTERKTWELSDGEKQRVFLAQAVVQEPSLLILDEPTSHLDIGHSFRILDTIKKLNAGGITVAAVLHDLNIASEYCSKLLLLKNGKVFSHGAPEEVLTYQNVEKVYETKVLVYKNPFSNKPYVFGIPAAADCSSGPCA
jgi:iron complex transport system ATP-binding protein